MIFPNIQIITNTEDDAENIINGKPSDLKKHCSVGINDSCIP